MLMRCVAIPYDRAQTAAINRLEKNGNSGSHAPDLHATSQTGIPSRIQMSDLIHYALPNLDRPRRSQDRIAHLVRWTTPCPHTCHDLRYRRYLCRTVPLSRHRRSVFSREITACNAEVVSVGDFIKDSRVNRRSRSAGRCNGAKFSHLIGVGLEHRENPHARNIIACAPKVDQIAAASQVICLFE